MMISPHQKPHELIAVHFRPHQRSLFFVVPFLLFTYALLLTDIFRSGPYVDLSGSMQYKPATYASKEPFAYSVINITKTTENSNTVFHGTKDNVKQLNTNIWSYKYDTTSMGIRSFAETTMQKSWPKCLFYEEKCSSHYLSLKQSFHMIDDLTESVKKKNSPSIFAQYNNRDFLRFHGVILSRFIDLMYEIFADFLLERKIILDVRIWYLDQRVAHSKQDETILCDPASDIPMTCTADMSNFEISSRDPKNKKIGRAATHVERRIRDRQLANPGMKVDGAFFEMVSYPISHVGGLVLYKSISFEAVLFTRVQNCTSNVDCETIQVDDFRYEGGKKVMDIDSWSVVVIILRYFAQGYFYLRLIAVLVGIYYAKFRMVDGSIPKNFRENMYLVINVFLQMPSQIVIYGSAFPVFMYFVAHCIDSPVVYAYASSNFSLLYSNNNLYQLVKPVTMFMRSVWVLATIAITLVYIQTSGKWRHTSGILGVRGFVIPVLSFLAVCMRLQHQYFRNSQVLQIWETSPTSGNSIQSVEGAITKRAIYRIHGALTDVIGVLVVGLAYRVCHWIFSHIYYSKTEDSNKFSRSCFFTKTNNLPSTAGVLWNPSSLCVGWDNNLFINNSLEPTRIAPTTEEMKQRKVEDHYRCVLMNVLILSDPLRYLVMRFSTVKIFKFVSPSGELRYNGQPIMKTIDNSTFQLVQEIEVAKQSWAQIVRYK